MPDSKITALTALTAADPAVDMFPVVDVSDTTMAASGTTKRISINNILACSPAATLASATITGDLTVATDRLKVVTGSTAIQTGATTQLQVGTTAWPSTVIGKSGSRSLFGNTGEVVIWNEAAAAIGNYSTLFVAAKTGAGATTLGGLQIRAGIENASNSDGFVSLWTSNNTAGGFVERYKIDSTGIATWSNVGGVAGTAMTLNATGLGVGLAPANDKLLVSQTIGLVTSTTADVNFRNIGNTTIQRIRYDDSTGTLTIGSALGTAYPVQIGGNTTTRAVTIDASQNVGIGVTPSAWASNYKSVQTLLGAALAGKTDGLVLAQNCYYDGTNWVNNRASTYSARYDMNVAGNSVHAWYVYNAVFGSAGNTIPFVQAMTLDASGNLLVGTTSALFNSRLRVKTSSTSASDYGVYVADSADALIFALRNDGLIYTGTKTASPYNNTTGSAANAFIASDGTLGRSTSSLKYKTDITDSTRGLADVLKLRPVTYKSKNGDDTIFGGLIAEEVHAAGLTEFVAYAPDNAPDAIHYSNMVSLLVAAIKELTARVQTLETR